MIILVCDVPVKDCKKWASNNYNKEDHCHASDHGSNSYYYKQQRHRAKTSSSVTPTSSLSNTASSVNRQHSDSNDCDRYTSNVYSPPVDLQRGPWDPIEGARLSTTAPYKGRLTKCRGCSYFNKFEHLNYTVALDPSKPNKKSYDIGFKDWCHACGRVASERDFEKVQSKSYVPVVGDVFFGEIVVQFKVKSHDPRKFQDVGDYWKKYNGNPGWTYDEAEMETDFFRHRIGRRPTLGYIIKSLPLKDDYIPEITGALRSDAISTKPCFTESEAIILENKKDKGILMEIYQFVRDEECFFRDNSELIGLDLTAEWDKGKRTGVSLFHLIAFVIHYNA